jgi:hypothetical protein
MGSVRALAAVALLAVAPGPPSAQPAGAPSSLAERIDLTRITILSADYTRAADRRDAAAIAAYEREVVSMLQTDVLGHVRSSDAALGPSESGTASGTAPESASVTPAVAVDEEEVGRASLDARVVALSSEFGSLAGKDDAASLSRKGAILGTLQAISEGAQFPSPLDADRMREGRQRAARERRDRQEFENLPAK